MICESARSTIIIPFKATRSLPLREKIAPHNITEPPPYFTVGTSNQHEMLLPVYARWTYVQLSGVIDEAPFWLNGYVNNEANPQVYVKTPLHPEKLTVWCALWAGGILLQKR
ncbi:hypothetical protein TNCV_4700781 [Trichonephila clavipes]|nr:hypothetical protein TNCV_4700781 [Trichonephila clavipes]